MPRRPIAKRLNDSVCTANLDWVSLREILSQQDDHGNRIVTDDEVCDALLGAAEKGHAHACRVLFASLSDDGKKDIQNCDGTFGEIIAWGSFDVVCFFVQECNFDLNRISVFDETPLSLACSCGHHVVVDLFLRYGADPNTLAVVDGHGRPLDFAIRENDTDMVRLLLQHGADPSLDVPDNSDFPLMTDVAFYHKNAQVLRMLLQHGAQLNESRHDLFGVEDPFHEDSARPNNLIDHVIDDRENKRAICRVMVEHAESNAEAKHFLQAALDEVISSSQDGDRNTAHCEILLQEAGITRPSRRAMYKMIRAGKESAYRLLVQYGVVEPFQQLDADDDDENSDDDDDSHDDDDDDVDTSSLFHAAAREANTAIFEFFLEQWDERFATSGGKNDDGAYPIHVISCDSRVSLEAAKLLQERQAHTLSTVDGKQGLFPFQLAAMRNTSLHVIYHLVKHSPDSLNRLRSGDKGTGNEKARRKRSNDSGPARKKSKTSL